MTVARALVVAKAPRAGHAKTRLGADVGMQRAAELAAAALLDTLRACTSAFGAEACCLALDGDLTTAVDADRLLEAVEGWQVFAQRGEGLADRLACSHLDAAQLDPAQLDPAQLDAARTGSGPLVQIGMDTPHATADDLRAFAAELSEHDAVLGEAEDGGWWALGLHQPRHAEVLRGVRMSTTTTGTDTRRALESLGLTVGSGARLRDVDTAADARAVAELCAAGSEFARLWRAS